LGRDAEVLTKKIQEIKDNLDKEARRLNSQVNLMEVCGTHTMAIFRYGIRKLLPPQLRHISGPGCPVCVTPGEVIVSACKLAQIEGVMVTTFGDMVRVPAVRGESLASVRSRGGQVRVVFSPFQALELAKDNPSFKIVFISIGFETTAPLIASVVETADNLGLKNFFILPANKLIPPAMEYLLNSGEINIHGFLAPGHVSVITGAAGFKHIVDKYKIPCVITGFEPADILEGIYMLVKQIVRGESLLEIQYKRCVKWEGNLLARSLMERIFYPVDSCWRGIGVIPMSGLALRKEFNRFSAGKEFSLKEEQIELPAGCLCGEVLKGVVEPKDCPLFGKICRPSQPVGPCMVSSEGSCAAYYKYG